MFLFHNSCAQVKDKAFDLMLDGLLSNSIRQIEVNELKGKINKQNVIILDSREQNEFQISHIAGATHIGYNNFKKSEVKDLPKDKEVIVYCSVGYRSEKIGEKLKKMGFKDVKNLRGGIFEWKNEGLPVVNNKGDTTNQVHAYDQKWGIWLTKGEKVYD